MVDRLRIFARPLFGLSLLLLLGAVLTFIVCQQMMRMKQTHEWVSHTYMVITKVDNLFQKITEADLNQRNFVNNGNTQHLERFHALTGETKLLDKQLSEIKTLIADNQAQSLRLVDLQNTINDKIAHMNHAIELAQAQSLDDAQAFLKIGEGRRLMDEILKKIKIVKDQEQRLLKIRTQNNQEATHINSLMSAMLIVLLLLTVSIAFVSIHKEMHRRQIIDKNLREVTSYQRAILDNALHMIIAFDPNGVIRLFNRASEKALGYSSEEMVNKKTPTVFHDHDEMASQAEALSKEFNTKVDIGIDVFTLRSRTQGSEEREWTFIRKDGSTFPVMLSVSTLRDDNGKITGYMGIAHDISERKQIDKIKNEFISTVSHELRTPLTSIRGSLGLIMGNVAGDIPEKAQNLIAIAYKNSERLTRLINDILDIEKIESGNITFDKRPLSVNAVVQQAIEENQGFADKYGIRLILKSDDKNALIMGNLDRLLQVLANFLSNAIKYAPRDSEVILQVSREGSAIRLSVIDKGKGIPEEFRSRIFQKFAQADSSNTRQNAGTGLGLNISKAIVEAMQGHVGFESEPGRTVFYATIPELMEGEVKATEVYPEQQQGKILICEDDTDISALLNMILTKQGFDCVIASTAAAAKEHLSKETFSAMTLDLALPDQDGLSLINELRDNEKTLPLPVIVISANAEQGKNQLNGDVIGVVDWLQKPIDMERLKRALISLPSYRKRPALLHIEDDNDLSQMMALSLQDIADVTFTPDLAGAREYLKLKTFDLVLLDILLPDGNGLDLLSDLAEKHIPVIILSVNQTPADIQKLVADSMIKSIVPEDKIVQTIRSFLQRKSP